MEILKLKLIGLLQESKLFSELAKLLTDDQSIEISSFTQTREYFLELHEIYLSNNNDMGLKVNGLSETVSSIKKSDISMVAINVIKSKYFVVGVYTDESYSLLLGVI